MTKNVQKEGELDSMKTSNKAKTYIYMLSPKNDIILKPITFDLKSSSLST